jgi:hypothetical protein
MDANRRRGHTVFIVENVDRNLREMEQIVELDLPIIRDLRITHASVTEVILTTLENDNVPLPKSGVKEPASDHKGTSVIVVPGTLPTWRLKLVCAITPLPLQKDDGELIP